MNSITRYFNHCAKPLLLCGAVVLANLYPAYAQSVSSQAAANLAASAPDLDMSIHYYNRVLTQEGVLRESRYEEKMLRRTGHVWVSRVLPKAVADQHDEPHGKERQIRPSIKSASTASPALKSGSHEHRHFSPVLIPRHILLEGDKLRLEFVDAEHKEVVSIVPTEYENANFDGSWANAYYLVDPKTVSTLPLSKRASPIPGARWHEQEKNGVFQRVLWDEKRMVALVVEVGNRAGTYFRRMEVKLQPSLSKVLPWQSVKGYASKEYSDFLD